MPLALDTITGFDTAPSTTLTAWTMATGDSLTVRNCDMSKRIFLADMWFLNQVAGIGRVRSPKLTDNVQGLRFRVPGNSQAFPLLDQRFPQRLYAQDTLIVEQSGSAVGGQIETGSLLVWYEDLPGVASRLIDSATLMKGGVELFTQETQHTTGAAGGYSGSVQLNANFDLMKANTDYALLGYETDAQNATVCMRGSDTGNVRVSGPCNNLLRDVTRWWFRSLADYMGQPCIPVINSANKSNTFCDIVANQVATAVNVNWLFIEMAPNVVGPMGATPTAATK